MLVWGWLPPTLLMLAGLSAPPPPLAVYGARLDEGR